MFYLTNILLFLGPALTLVMRSGYIVLGLSFLLLTLFLLKDQSNRQWLLSPSAKLMCIGLWSYAVIAIVMNIYHGQISTQIETFLPMLLYPLLFLVVPKLPLRANYLWTGAAVGAIGAGLIAIYQTKILGVTRANGFYYNPIPFGDLSLVLSAASFIGLLRFPLPHRTWLIKPWLAVGGCFGLTASLLSGTKGGWLTLVTVVLVSAWILSSAWQWWRRMATLAISIALIAGAVHLAPRAAVMGRIESGLAGGITWFQTGQVVDGSVSIRLALFAEGLSMFQEHPLLGWDWKLVSDEQERRNQAKGVPQAYSRVYGAFENEYIDKMVAFGIVGLISDFLIFAFPLLAFWRHRQDKDAQISSFAFLGMMLPIMFMEFGLSVSVLSLNAMRHVYVAWCVMLMCLILHRQRELDAT